MSEIPVHFRPRRLADWINPTGAKKVHSLVDKVYKRKCSASAGNGESVRPLR
jgi:RNA-directed DNA polymerase